MDLFQGVFLGIQLAFVSGAIWLLLMKRHTMRFPMLIESLNTALIIGGWAIVLALLAAVVDLVTPDSRIGSAAVEGIRIIEGPIPLWGVGILFAAIFLLPPQLMWLRRIRTSWVSSLLIALLWSVLVLWVVLLYASQPRSMDLPLFTLLGSMLSFWGIMVIIYVSKMKRSKTGA